MANKTDDKTLTLGRLYALRAGLSVVAQEKEKADGIIDRAKKDKQRAIADADSRIGAAEKSLRYEEDKLAAIPKKMAELSGNANAPGIALRVLLKTLYILPIAAFIGAALFGIAQYIYDCYLLDKVNSEVVKKIFGWLPSSVSWLVIIGGIGLTVVMFMFAVPFVEDDILKCAMWEKKRAQAEIAMLYKEKSEQQQAIEKAHVNINKAKQQKQADIKAADAAIDEARKKATEHAVAGLTVIEGLENTFGDMIDARDWENTDIIIYALETRRAEDIKEALAVVDHERHTERIIEAVNSAGQEICKTINTGLRRLQGEMTRCFGLLSDQIIVQTEIMANEMSGIRSGISSNNEYIAKLTSQQSMSNALLAKANENSAAIASEVAALRSTVVINHNKEQTAFAHYTYWGS